ncbi:hypothetical protein J2T57_001511 [Natronocella acetinitrilica]|uniref:Uncharacterized protein n=1 Tax=Natronocella acetinitrilica TaxID=414046 RepID=A0AAE3G2G6_9GAMM|nr:hypothetical protein [Natronocella acetinitrilica]MCP1674409.1 hypothetical protein [Natronocella acetinitrilica]
MTDGAADRQVVMTMSERQAQSMGLALELLMRVGIGQFEYIGEIARMGVLSESAPADRPRKEASLETCQQLDAVLTLAKGTLGHPPHGSFGIHHAHVGVDAKNAYELLCVLRQALAIAREQEAPAAARGVAHRGLTARVTGERAPKARVESGAGGPGMS